MLAKEPMDGDGRQIFPAPSPPHGDAPCLPERAASPYPRQAAQRPAQPPREVRRLGIVSKAAIAAVCLWMISAVLTVASITAHPDPQRLPAYLYLAQLAGYAAIPCLLIAVVGGLLKALAGIAEWAIRVQRMQEGHGAGDN